MTHVHGLLRERRLQRNRNVVVILLALTSIGLSLGTVATYLVADAPDFGAAHAGATVAADGGNAYDPAAVGRVEIRDENGAGAGVLPYVYPPNLTALQLPLARLPYSTALHLWGALIVASAVATVAFVVRAVWRRRVGIEAAATVCALGLVFAPLRRGLELGQVDPLLALPAVAGLLLALGGRDAAGGVALSALLLKPQLAAFPLMAVAASRRPRLVLGVLLGVLAQVCIVVALNTSGLHLDLIAWLHSLRSGDPHRPLVVATEIVALAVTTGVTAVCRPWRALVDRRDGLVLLVSMSAVMTAIVGPWAKLNPQSDVLLIVPAGLVAADVMHAAGTRVLSARRTALVGCVTGALLGDTLYAVAHYSGYGEAAVAIATVGFVLAAVAVARPRLAPACAIAAVVNAALTAPMFPPGYDGVVSALAATGLAVLVCTSVDRRQDSTVRPCFVRSGVTELA